MNLKEKPNPNQNKSYKMYKGYLLPPGINNV